ncbi:hypothetical protein E1200_21990 [Actinomadura sp. GC306]|uniref:hypothetical protein n=1 Tax=Actinomadura sp. GC306 TaxID=2530367 RepID=UPI0010467A8A|nr:hypothetical protein [Actinomadura sp. GC306]TDC63553.1 hypothetical protein E1200_21990 [Actinomadura sp. GC306]
MKSREVYHQIETATHIIRSLPAATLKGEMIVTGQSSPSANSAPPYIRPLYRPAADGVVRLYAGDLSVTDHKGTTYQARGDLEFRFAPRPGFYAHLASDEQWLFHLKWGTDVATIEPLAGASLDPPTRSELPARPEHLKYWADRLFRISTLEAGDISNVHWLLIHVSGRLSDQLFPVCQTDAEEQGQLAFELPSWKLRLAAADEWREGEEFPFVIEAVPQNLPVTSEDAGQLQRRLFLLLSFIAGREVELGATAGLDSTGRVVWATWETPRIGTGQWRWCPDHLVNDALPELARGFTQLAADPTMEKVADRAINLNLTANGTQPLDVRIPVVASGLELVGWAVLQTQQWLTTDAVGKLNAAHMLRLLLQWANISIDMPSSFTALEARRAAFNNQPDEAGPDLLTTLRNNLVHPPKKLAKLEWPTDDEMKQAWRLGMHYLELVILRLLDYQGQYLPRLQLINKWVTDTETVPWAK